ncbi:MAG: DUF1043 family protein [Halieaceae bacterium]|nr:DUF1043 family protein [Halieaceae bacterium]
MYELSSLLMTALIALVVGGGLGALVARRYSFDGRKQRELERSVDKLLQQQKDYQHEVVEHFTDTAKLLNNLAESYRDVHNHLATGASQLCADEAGSILRAIPEGSLAQVTSSQEPQSVQPPLDYAPKASPFATGTLNEEFGLDKSRPVGPDFVASEPAIVEEPAVAEEREDVEKSA